MKKIAILCKLGFHKWSFVDRWEPNIHARIVTRFKQTATCSRCGETKTTKEAPRGSDGRFKTKA